MVSRYKEKNTPRNRTEYSTDANEAIDWKNMSINETFDKLRSTSAGLSSDEAGTRLSRYGLNKLPEQKVNKYLLFLGFMWNPLSWAMEIAAILAIVLLDFADVVLIVVLLLLNACIGFFEENQAGNAVAALIGKLAPECKALRNGSFVNIPAENLVPGDIIRVRLGDIIPADIKFISGTSAKIDQSSLTGESLPVSKAIGDEGFSGTIVKQGEMEGVVTGTGANTFLGRAADLLNCAENHGRLQEVLTTVGNFCILSIVLWCIIELISVFGINPKENPCIIDTSGCLGLENLLVLIVGGIPVAMPTVLSVTLAIGSTVLAKQDAIVTRLTCIEEMASMEVLCSDKTGTLTLNELSIDYDNIICYNSFTQEDLFRDAALAARTENNEAIDVLCFASYHNRANLWKEFKLLRYTPFDPATKRTIAKVKAPNGTIFQVSKGAPQVILEMCKPTKAMRSEVNMRIEGFASRGYRALGICRAEEGDFPDEEVKWKFVGLLPLFDPPRHDTEETIRKAIELGVAVKMITGDQKAIAIETCRQLGMPTNILDTSLFKEGPPPGTDLAKIIYNTDGFAEVFPEHKYEIVKQLQSLNIVVGMTGDGVNDAPALKQANIGIAVDDATDAARAAADIVLVSPGLSVIITAIQGSREIFQRMKNYAMYSIAMTIRVVFTFGLLSVAWKWYFPTLLIVILAILNDGTILTISNDNVEASPEPDSWKLKEIFVASLSFGFWLTISTVLLFYITRETQYFSGFLGAENLCIPCLRNHCNDYVESQYRSCNSTSLCGNIDGSIENSHNFSSIQIFRNELVNGYWANFSAREGQSFDTLFKHLTANTLNHLGTTPSAKESYEQYIFQYTAGNSTAPLGQSYSPVLAAAGGEGIEFNGVDTIALTNGLDFCHYLWDYGSFNDTWSRGYHTIGPGMQRKDSVLRAFIYMQISISGQALIFVTRTAGANTWFFLNKPSNLLLIAFVIAQIVASLIGAIGFNGYPTDRTAVVGCGVGYTVVAWIWTIGWHFPLDLIKFTVNYLLARNTTFYQRLAFTAQLNAGHPSMRHSRISSRQRSLQLSRRTI